jgi:hypothetical protein
VTRRDRRPVKGIPGITYPGQAFTIEAIRMTDTALLSAPPHMGWRPARSWEIPVIERAHAAGIARAADLLAGVLTTDRGDWNPAGRVYEIVNLP